MIYPLPNYIGAAVEVWKWISNLIPYFTEHVIFLLIHAGVRVDTS